MSSIILSSVIANKPFNGGNAWVVLSWLLGLRRMGFDVYFVEQIRSEDCVDEQGHQSAFETSANLSYFRRIMEEYGFAHCSTLICDEGAKVAGVGLEELEQLAAEASLLVNITGHLTHTRLMRRIRRKLYLDLDPGFTQFWHAQGSSAARLEAHDFHFTIGENIGQTVCPIPTSGIRWRTTRQPALLSEWPVSRAVEREGFTTIASWRGAYGRIEHEGRAYGLKAHEFRKFFEMPARTGRRFEIALDIHPAERNDLEQLREHGWHTVEPRIVVPDAESFRRYVQTSAAEFSVAQGIYVETRSGWFSDRTVRYLSAGKPALVQETGFSRQYPSGSGLLAFTTLDEAVAGAEKIARDYAQHCAAARALAEEYFASEKVLGRLLEETGV